MLEAEKILGGSFPNHVGAIRIMPDLVKDYKQNTFICGRCYQTSRGPSKIEIYAGSISEISGGADIGCTTRVTLHEVGHSLRIEEIEIQLSCC